MTLFSCAAGSSLMAAALTLSLPTLAMARSVGATRSRGDDPHNLKLWNATQYSYRGECDLVLLDNKDFHDGLGMDIHIRMTQKSFYSFIESAAIRIGNDILEFSSDYFWINGVLGSDSELPTTIGGFPLPYPTYSESGIVKYYRIELNHGDYINIASIWNFIGVQIHGKSQAFGTSVGMLGDYYTSAMLARDGMTVLHNVDEFGAEWQVHEDEPKLFRTLREPQHPHATCKPFPEASAEALRRHLREDRGGLGKQDEDSGV